MSARDFYMKDDISTAARKKRMGHKNVSALAAYFGRHLNDPNHPSYARLIPAYDSEIRDGERRILTPLGDMIRFSLNVPGADVYPQSTKLHKFNFREMVNEDPEAFAEFIRIQQEIPDPFAYHVEPWTYKNLAGLLSRTNEDFRKMSKGKFGPILQSLPRDFYQAIDKYRIRDDNIPEYNPNTDSIEDYDRLEWVNSPGTVTFYNYHLQKEQNRNFTRFNRPDNRPWETLEIKDKNGNVVRRGRQPGTYQDYYKMHDRLAKISKKKWPRDENLPFVSFDDQPNEDEMRIIKRYDFNLTSENSWNMPIPNIKKNLKLNKDPKTVWFSGITKYPDDLGNENNLSQNAFNNWRQPIEDYEVYHNFNNLNISNNIHNIPEFRDTQIQEHNYDDVLTDGEVHEIMQTTISKFVNNLKLNK